jgi:hypothetical protein
MRIPGDDALASQPRSIATDLKNLCDALKLPVG